LLAVEAVEIIVLLAVEMVVVEQGVIEQPQVLNYF
tara:strand:- start:567 stop:671 length:105 start_codon:yes stop_codon:yes gene_type:complete